MNQPHNLTQEADIGSGERSPEQRETDKMIEKVPANKPVSPKTAIDQPNVSERNGTDAQSGNPP